MALFILNPGITPLGDFDVLDTDAGNILGGEVMVLDKSTPRKNTASEKAAQDVFDGYVAPDVDTNDHTAYRVVARIGDTNPETQKLFFLADEGKAHYGVMFGSVIGTPVGLSTTGTNLGPHTTAGSGKVTLWDKPGLYAVSLDAIDAAVVNQASGHLFDTPLPGDVLYRSSAGLLARVGQAGSGSDKIAAFVELTDKGALVNTPGRLVGAAETFDRIKIFFYGADKNA